MAKRRAVKDVAGDDFRAILAKLKAILKKYERRCIVELDTDDEYFINFKRVDAKNKPVYFAGVSINKITISFHLVPVSEFPELLDSASPELLQHLHGKSCFRFKRNEPALFKELAVLTKRAFERCEGES